MSDALNSAATGGSYLDQVWDFGKNIFARGADYYFETKETENAVKLRKAETQAELARQNSYVQLQGVAGQLNSIEHAKVLSLAAIGVLSLAALSMMLKKK